MRAVLAASAILLVLAGITGSAPAAQAGLARSALIARANGFCTAAKSEFRSLSGPGGVPDIHTPAAGRAIRSLEHQVNRLKAVRPAAAAARQWWAFVRAVAVVDHLLAPVAKAPRGDLTALARLAQAASAAAAAGVKLGARACAV